MKIIALDLSKRSTGWAAWQPGWDAPRFGQWVLGSEYTSDGQTFAKLHQRLSEVRQVVCRFDTVAMETPITPSQLQGFTTIQTIRLAIGLAAHAQSFAYAMGCRPVTEVNVASWRPDFIGKIEDQRVKSEVRRKRKAGDKKVSGRDELKYLTMLRCQQLGLSPRTNDEADAIGILTYCLLSNDITPPWLKDEVLRPLLVGEDA